MSDHSDDAGTIQALLDRLVKWRLPRTMELKKRIDAGERLTDTDVAFLKEMLEDAQRSQHVVARNPEVRSVGVQLVQLYSEIITKAAENEKGA